MCRVYLPPAQVAGATLMALGCNGPELSLNTKLVSSVRHLCADCWSVGVSINLTLMKYMETICIQLPACFMEDPQDYVGTSPVVQTDKCTKVMMTEVWLRGMMHHNASDVSFNITSLFPSSQYP